MTLSADAHRAWPAPPLQAPQTCLPACHPDGFPWLSLAFLQANFFLPPLQLQDRQTTAKWENANCKLAVLQVFPASLLSHHYLLTLDFLVSVGCLLIEYKKNAWNHYHGDRQAATMFLARQNNFKALCPRHFSIKGAQSGFKHQILMQPGFRRSD